MSDQVSVPEPVEKTPAEQVVEHAVELFVYAPIGLLFEGSSLLPQLVEKGRGQVAMARMLGRFAVKQGRSRVTKVLDLLGDSVVPTLAEAPRPVADAQPRPKPARPPAPPTVSSDGLAIPDYDGLSASHVVNRLAGLSGPELQAVQAYEAATRGRKTILSKVAQLQAR